MLKLLKLNGMTNSEQHTFTEPVEV